MAEEVKREEIDRLPRLAQIAYAARCVRIVFKAAVPHHWRNPPTWFDGGLQTAERLGRDATQWTLAQRVAERLRSNEYWNPTEGEANVLGNVRADVTMVLNIPPNHGSGGQLGHTLTAALIAVVNCALSEQGKIEADEEATDRAAEAYGTADHAAKLAACHDLFSRTAREDYEALRRYFDSLEKPVPPLTPIPCSFFEDRNSEYYQPPTTD